jgi:hypothetical protein
MRDARPHAARRGACIRGKATRAALRATSVPAGVSRSGELAVGCSSLSTGCAGRGVHPRAPGP